MATKSKKDDHFILDAEIALRIQNILQHYEVRSKDPTRLKESLRAMVKEQIRLHLDFWP